MATSKQKTLGQVITPKELVTLVLDTADYKGGITLTSTILEPSFGSGAFLVEIVKRIINSARAAGKSNNELCSLLNENVWGIEIDKALYARAVKRLNSVLASEGVEPIEWSRLVCGDTFEVYEDFKSADFVVGNPPFINVHNLSEERLETLKGVMQFSQGAVDTYIAFYEIGMQLLSDKGKLAFISPNGFLRNSSNQEFRNHLITEGWLSAIYDFKATKMFEGADTYTCVCVLDKNRAAEIHCRDYNGFKVINDFTIAADEFYDNYMDKPWYLYPKQHRNFLDANAAHKFKLGDIAEVQNGIATQLDSVYVGTAWLDMHCTQPYDPPFSDDDKSNVWFKSNEGDTALVEKDVIRPCVKGSTVSREKSHEYIIFPYIVTEGGVERYDTEELFKLTHPYAYAYLAKFKDRLLARDSDKNSKWFEYGRSQGLRNANVEKIVFKTFISNTDTRVEPYILGENVVVYSGVFITTPNPDDIHELCEAIASPDFFQYAKLTGEMKGSGYIRIGSTKVIKEFGVDDYVNPCPLKKDSIFKENDRNICNGLDLLADIKTNTIKVAFFDPQYRGLFDKMNYGNEGDRQSARSELPQMDTDTIHNFLKEIDRVLRPSGYLFLWLDKFHLVEGVAPWLDDLPDLHTVDLITWDKQRMGMGYRTRRQSEYLLVIQKEPLLAKATWTSHSIPDIWSEQAQKTHAHAKPIGLQEQLIRATTSDGDYVLDPAAGSYSVKDACDKCNRNFVGCDLLYG